jgi:hypothetical protein
VGGWARVSNKSKMGGGGWVASTILYQVRKVLVKRSLKHHDSSVRETK